jgi:acetylornithine/succinyldiaminopimelate/putrescine aminotransferase
VTHTDIVQLEERFQIKTYRKKPISVVRGEGCWVWDAGGTRYLDLYGGHCVTLLGHNHPGVTEALKAQLDQLLFYSNAVFSPVRARAAEALGTMAPIGLQNVFFCSTGTEANETAIKLARKTTGRTKMLAMEGGFHGRTMGSLSVTHGKYRDPYKEAMAPTTFIPFGDARPALAALRTGAYAGLIIEPMQSMAGMRESTAGYFRLLREACNDAGTVLIFDEIQTGVGRTGTFSISERYGILPDLITMAKSLGNGVPVGAVLVSDAISGTVRYGDQGTTFGGGMLAMAAVEATLAAIRDEDIMEKARRIEVTIRHRLGPKVKEIRGGGCLLGLDLGIPVASVVSALLQDGILVGGSNNPNVIRVMPPAITPLDEIERFTDTLEACMREAPGVA